MKYTGRIVMVSFVILTTIGWMIHYYVSFDLIHYKQFYFNIPFILLAYFLGKRHDEATYYSRRDHLTGAFNRYYITKCFKKNLQKKTNKMTLFIADVNNFKPINDQYGHEMGDKVLCKVTDAIQKNIRDTDYLCRWGGDEFLVITPKVNEEGAQKMVQRWKESLKPILKDFQVEVTISIGVATYPNEGKSLDDLVRLADKRMYEEKKLKISV
ncbi:GGDEF domain-containing protein [Salirhabdus salicampi]|uniref:GGDEF domain-containing protein n=1 Tax=Salirhabdus salicampi TaxID=476102 RepID=UPI0020C448CB|nr:GGDEF domain-containing protein [Salirhabdus salicampi]MCP8615685.1 GGDEF domain-containing protein [Salirhabdus salicampi]